MRVVFAGTPDPAVPSLRRFIESGRHEVVAVVTRPDAVAGRGRKVTRSPVGLLADEHGIPVLTPRRPSDPEFVERLTELAPDCCPVVAYGALLPPRVLDIPRFGWINLHFSLLPAWRGAAPVQAAINAGDEVTGASTFQIEEGLDTGPVFGVVTEKIAVTDTSGTLLARLAESGARLLETTVDGVEDGTLQAIPQSTDGVSYAPKVTAEDGHIRWDQPALSIGRRVRAVTPAPGAWTEVGGIRLKVGPVELVEEELPARAVEVRKTGVFVGTATTAVRLDQVQPQGKRMMSALDWARGARLAPGAEVARPVPALVARHRSRWTAAGSPAPRKASPRPVKDLGRRIATVRSRPSPTADAPGNVTPAPSGVTTREHARVAKTMTSVAMRQGPDRNGGP